MIPRKEQDGRKSRYLADLIMAKPNSNRDMKRRGKCKPFIMLENHQFDSEAFNSLSSSAIRVYLSIIRCKNPKDGKKGTMSEPILCPYSVINGNMSNATIAKAIRELEEKGFIELARHGGLMKQPNLYAFSGEWINWRKKTIPKFKK